MITTFISIISGLVALVGVVLGGLFFFYLPSYEVMGIMLKHGGFIFLALLPLFIGVQIVGRFIIVNPVIKDQVILLGSLAIILLAVIACIMFSLK